MFQNLIKQLATALALELIPFIQAQLEEAKNELIASSAVVEPTSQTPPTSPTV